MNSATGHLAGARLHLWIVIFIAAVLAIYAGVMIGSDPIVTVIVCLAILIPLMWVTTVRQAWWILMPAAGAFGGYFYFGFKLYPHEIALVGCLLPLAMARAIRSPSIFQRNRPLFPLAMYLLSVYLVLHLFGSNFYNREHGEGGYGSVTRAYFNALWVIVFLFAYRNYGSSKYIRAALFLTYLASLARVLMGVVLYFTANPFSDTVAYVPIINYVLPGSTHSGSDDLRVSGLSLASLAVCYFLIKKGPIQKLFHLGVFLASCFALAFGGGRVALILACAIPVFASALHRRIVPLIVSALAVAGIIVAINIRPQMLDNLPFRVQRTCSILIWDKDEAARYGLTLASDKWHEDLRKLGYSKWTQSWNTFLFGTGIRPPTTWATAREYIPGKSTQEELEDSASRVGAYESGWWTVTAVTGLVGLLLYLGVLLYLLRKLAPILLHEGVRDHIHACAFLGLFGVVNWIGLGWTNGGFPSTEIMFGFLAVFALSDQKHGLGPMRRVRRVVHAPPLEPVLQPSRIRSEVI